jgi:hypothetical protein
MTEDDKKKRAKKIRRLFDDQGKAVSMLAARFSLTNCTIRKILRNEIAFDADFRPKRKIELKDVLEEILGLKDDADISNAKAAKIIAGRHGRDKPWAESTVRAAVRKAIEDEAIEDGDE